MLHKEYPEGYRWVELKPAETLNPEYELKQVQGKYGRYWDLRKPGAPYGHTTRTDAEALRASNRKALEDALKYEGDTMGHCVGGYCDDVVSGESRIYSLRDKKGQPHTTIEVALERSYGSDHLNAQRPMAESEAIAAGLDPESSAFSSYVNAKMDELAKSNLPLRIVQIKGKQNKAPNPEYLPYVQDFVRSGKWSDVGDLQNTGLKRLRSLRDELHPELYKRAESEYGGYLTDEDLKALLSPRPEPGYAAGGLVTYNPADIDDRVSQLLAELESEGV